MPDFVSTPPPRREKVPVVTLNVLIDALVEYLLIAFDFLYSRSDIWPEREFGISKTTIYFYDRRRVTPPIKAAIEVEITGKFAQSGTSKLFSEPFMLSIWERPEVEPPLLGPSSNVEDILKRAEQCGTSSGLLVIPQADRSLRFRPVIRWENGVPIFD